MGSRTIPAGWLAGGMLGRYSDVAGVSLLSGKQLVNDNLICIWGQMVPHYTSVTVTSDALYSVIFVITSNNGSWF